MKAFCLLCKEPFLPHDGSAGYCSDHCAQVASDELAAQAAASAEADEAYERYQAQSGAQR